MSQDKIFPGYYSNSWQVLLDQDSISQILLDNKQDSRLIQWLEAQPEWFVETRSKGLTLFRRKGQNLLPPEEILMSSQSARLVNPPVYLLISLLLILILTWIFPQADFLVFPWNLSGLLPLGLGILLNLLTDGQFQTRHTTVKPGEKSTVLMTEGVFRYSRNPMYLGMILILVGFALLLDSWVSLLVVPGFITLIYYRFICLEEKMLKEQFGEDWLMYQKNVPRWI
jgi:protein-S-isoprenylcysteine O-methyltransferase Ste14